MEGEDHKPTGGTQQRGDLSQRWFEAFEFVIYGDPYRLKGPRGEVEPSVQVRRRYRFSDDLNQRQSRQNGALGSPPGDSLSNASRVALLSVFRKDPAQLLLRQAIDEIRSRHGVPHVHPHVQRSVRHKTEPPGGRVQLQGGDSQVPQGAIEIALCRLSHHMRGITIGSLHDQRPIAVRAERLPGRRHRCCVTIQPDDPPIRPTRFKDGHAVSSRPSRPVEIDPTSPWLQPSQHFLQHHRAVHDCNPDHVPSSAANNKKIVHPNVLSLGENHSYPLSPTIRRKYTCRLGIVKKNLWFLNGLENLP